MSIKTVIAIGAFIIIAAIAVLLEAIGNYDDSEEDMKH